MITDEDLTPIDLADFWEDEEPVILTEPAPSSRGIVPEYVDRQIARIPVYGDGSRWRLASHLDMFENLSPDGTLTPEQRQAVDNFAIGWPAERSESDEFDFPECQYIANGIDPQTAKNLGDTYRAGDVIEPIGHEIADRISNRLNQMQRS